MLQINPNKVKRKNHCGKSNSHWLSKGKQRSPSAHQKLCFCFPMVFIKSKQKSPSRKIKKKGENKEANSFFYRRRNYENPYFNYSNTRSIWKLAVRQEKKRYVTTVEPLILKRLSSADDQRVAKIGLAMEKVMILRRGEKETFCFFPLSSLFFCWGFFVCF